MRTEADILARLFNIRSYYQAEWVSREVAEPSVNELLWALGYEELSGGAFLDEQSIYNERTETHVVI